MSYATMSMMLDDHHEIELPELSVTEDPPFFNGHADLADDNDYNYDNHAPLEPLSNLAAFQNLDDPLLPTMAVTDSMSALDGNHNHSYNPDNYHSDNDADDNDYHYDITAPLDPLIAQKIAGLQNLAVPEGVQFYINGHLVPPGMAMGDAMSAFFGNDDDHDDHYYDEEECYGCRTDSNTRADHTGSGGCLEEPLEWGWC